MQHILVLGAGLSASYLIKYLLSKAPEGLFTVTVADANAETALHKIGNSTFGKAIGLDASDTAKLNSLISEHDIVLSLLPPTMHPVVARYSIANKKHFISASYVSPEMLALHTEAEQAGVLLLNECGLDPGIDHASAMKLIHDIQSRGGEITSFKSYCGGLIAPEYDDNPWHYKFTWNPRNVVLAGQATAKYLHNGQLKYITPRHIFEQTEPVSINGLGNYESYANRDSLGYIIPYGIESAHTVLRGTLRSEGYCKAWNQLVKLGLTDDTFVIDDANAYTYREWLNAFVPGNDMSKLEARVATHLAMDANSVAFQNLVWLGIFDNQPILQEKATPAQILQHLLEQKWKLKPAELDMIVMKHIVSYTLEGKTHEVSSELVVKGEDEVYTAMSKTVGMPIAIAALQLLQQNITLKGVHIPIHPQVYNPILDELKQVGINFNEY
jgi:saccharopine dehydrogenase-like NADP-dependent oxidoreductase